MAQPTGNIVVDALLDAIRSTYEELPGIGRPLLPTEEDINRGLEAMGPISIPATGLGYATGKVLNALMGQKGTIQAAYTPLLKQLANMVTPIRKFPLGERMLAALERSPKKFGVDVDVTEFSRRNPSVEALFFDPAINQGPSSQSLIERFDIPSLLVSPRMLATREARSRVGPAMAHEAGHALDPFLGRGAPFDQTRLELLNNMFSQLSPRSLNALTQYPKYNVPAETLAYGLTDLLEPNRGMTTPSLAKLENIVLQQLLLYLGVK